MIGDAASAGVDMIQVRERDLSAREMTEIARDAARAVEGTRVRLFVNDRFDVAIAAGAEGVHLTTRSLEADVVRRCTGERLALGVSTHTIDEVRAAEAAGAEFVVYGPIFDTPSKRGFGDPVGLDALARVTSSRRIPVLALGGIDADNAYQAMAAGAAGIAAIRLFQQAWIEGGGAGLEALVARLRIGRKQ